jgi:hypothetical protein
VGKQTTHSSHAASKARIKNEERLTSAAAAPFVWPLGNRSDPDEMNTSYGPRIDADRWDFHDGIDLPAPVGTPIHAMANGVVHRAGPADKTAAGSGFGSTHVLLKVEDPKDGKDDLFLVYLHLDSIAEGIIQGATVKQGDLIGSVGQEDAEYSHLHFEFRKGTAQEERSVHPLNYLPYDNTSNLTNLKLDRCNFYRDNGDKKEVRLTFKVPNRREGDLRGVHVKLTGSGITDRELDVDFDKRATINSDKGDDKAFKNGIAVEGYQKSNLKGDGLSDLRYGVLVNDIDPEFATVEFRALDVRNRKTQITVPLPTLPAGESPVNSRATFEAPPFPPRGWELKLLPGNVCETDDSAALKGAQGLLCSDLKSLSGTLIRTGLSFPLPTKRMSWRLGADIRAAALELKTGQVIHPLAFLAGNVLVGAVSLRNIGGDKFIAGVLMRSANGLFRERIDVIEGEILLGTAVRCELDISRLGTRQTTAVLRLNSNVVARINGDTTVVEPDRAFVGILHRHSKLQITLHIDQLALTEEPRF